MSVKGPPKEVLKELKTRGHRVLWWTKRAEWWHGYSPMSNRFVTVTKTENGAKAVVDILERDSQFEVPL